jgi:hypothetical protein
MAKGCRIAGMRPSDMPSNWLSLHPSLRPKAVVAISNRCEAIARRFATRLEEGAVRLRSGSSAKVWRRGGIRARRPSRRRRPMCLKTPRNAKPSRRGGFGGEGVRRESPVTRLYMGVYKTTL